MKNRKNLLGILAIMLVFGTLLIGCSSENAIVGTWVSDIMGIQSETTYASDGTVTDVSMGMTTTGTYVVKGKTVTVTYEGLPPTSFDFEVKGDTLTYSFMGMTFTAKRK